VGFVLFVSVEFLVVLDGRPVLFDPVPAGGGAPVVGFEGAGPVACAKPNEEKKAKTKRIVITRTPE